MKKIVINIIQENSDNKKENLSILNNKRCTILNLLR